MVPCAGTALELAVGTLGVVEQGLHAVAGGTPGTCRVLRGVRPLRQLLAGTGDEAALGLDDVRDDVAGRPLLAGAR